MLLNKNDRITLYLVRHGESEMNRIHNNTELVGSRAPLTPLSLKGEEQSIKLGFYLHDKGMHIDQLHSSTLIRATKTSELLNKQFDTPLSIQLWEDLIEYTQGDWDGKPTKEVYTPEIYNLKYQQNSFSLPPSGESRIMVSHRIGAWYQREIVQKFRGTQSHLIVCHSMVIKCFLYYIMNFNDSLIHKIDIDNTSITKVSFDWQGWHIHYINKTTHLE
jgi:phosphoserine phosphatase